VEGFKTSIVPTQTAGPETVRTRRVRIIGKGVGIRGEEGGYTLKLRGGQRHTLRISRATGEKPVVGGRFPQERGKGDVASRSTKLLRASPDWQVAVQVQKERV